jgi:4-phytase/acid phosphatase
MRLAILVFFAASVASAQPPKLAYVVILSRHGVRSPTASAADLRQYAADPWPAWSAAPGELTEHGRKAMTVLGAWYRAWLAHDGLFPAGGCEQSMMVHVRADVGQRTHESGRSFAQGLFPGCPPEVQVVSANADPLFHPVSAGAVHSEGALAMAAVSGRIGANPAALAGVYRHAFETLDEILGRHGLTGLPASLQATEDGLADIRGPLRTGSTLAENLLLEYAEGMTGKDLGWGRLDPDRLNEIMAIHTAYADLARRTSYLASVQGSNLLEHMLLSMEQAASGKPVTGALGKPGDRLLVLAGHDTNISHISGMLNLSWLIPGYQRDDTPPGGSLVFRLWRDTGGSAFSVDVLFIAQTLDQLRSSSPLSLTSPPGMASVFLPGCRPIGAHLDCRWDVFRRIVSRALELKTP